MPDVVELKQHQIDALRELGNIGSGNAATALAQFLNRKIDMAVPQAKIVPMAQVPSVAGGAEERIIGIFLKVLGNISGNFLLVIPEKTGFRLLDLLIPATEARKVGQLGDLERSCLREIGNILAGAFLNALSCITQTPMLNSLPSLAYDMAGALIDSVVAEHSSVSEHVLMIETSFIDDHEDLRIHIFLLPAPESLNKLLELLGVK